MSHDTEKLEPAPRSTGIVERLVRDDVDRKRLGGTPVKRFTFVFQATGPLIKS
jgi:hypothetical protein